jgi:hypothetical protein
MNKEGDKNEEVRHMGSPNRIQCTPSSSWAVEDIKPNHKVTKDGWINPDRTLTDLTAQNLKSLRAQHFSPLLRGGYYFLRLSYLKIK